MKTITFYSYKGGVGRSLALANIALRLSEFNKRVCLLDFDLEAPGLPIKFSKYIRSNIIQGLVDYIYEYASKGVLPKSISEYSIDFKINRNNSLSLIPAGNIHSSEYWRKLSSIDWYNLLYENNNSISFFLDLKEKINKEIKPDFLLIDSRTGISEMSGITISLLADDVVVVSANNEENLSGSKKIIDSLLNVENSIFGKVPKITFILSRIPFTDHPEDRAKEQVLTSKVQSQLKLQLNEDFFVIHSDRELELNEQLKISNEIDGTSVQITRDYLKLFERLTEDVLTQDDIDKFDKLKKSERFYFLATQEKSFSKKLEFISSAILLNKNNVDYYFYRSGLYNLIDRIEDAIEDLQAICEIDGSLKSTVLNQIGAIYLSVDRYNDAIKYYSMNPPYGYLGLGDSYTGLRSFELAIEYYSRAIASDPGNFDAYNNRANAYIDIDRVGPAAEDVFKALEIDPNNSNGYITLARIYDKTNQTNEFYLCIENALKLDSNRLKINSIVRGYFSKYLKEDRFIKLLDKYSVFWDEPF